MEVKKPMGTADTNKKLYITDSVTRQVKTVHTSRDCPFLKRKIVTGVVAIDVTVLRVHKRCGYCFG